MPLATFCCLITEMRDVKLPFFLVPWAEGREANFCRVPRLMLGTFTAFKISITHFLPTPLATFLVTYHKDEGCQTSIFWVLGLREGKPTFIRFQG